MHKSGGFTLIELMVTMAVMAVVVMMAAPSFNNMLIKQNMNKSARDLIATFTEAKAKAVLERRIVTVKLKTKCAPEDQPDCWQPSDKAVLKNVALNTVEFRPNGLVNSAADMTFEICNQASGNTSKKVTITRMGTIQLVAEGSCT
ncbi:prepilin-type N-terminal cleavage/methylation domain-containing protein [Acinetobacter sp. WCHAc010034]|nr:prepilin-type N-terminal cleavage/methylation domain-containing protein [Acinetobacter sp. WCHAc010034]